MRGWQVEDGRVSCAQSSGKGLQVQEIVKSRAEREGSHNRTILCGRSDALWCGKPGRCGHVEEGLWSCAISGVIKRF